LNDGMERADLVNEHGIELKVWASLGGSGYPWDAESADQLIQQADASMYVNKRARKQAQESPVGEEIEVTARLGKSAIMEN